MRQKIGRPTVGRQIIFSLTYLPYNHKPIINVRTLYQKLILATQTHVEYYNI